MFRVFSIAACLIFSGSVEAYNFRAKKSKPVTEETMETKPEKKPVFEIDPEMEGQFAMEEEEPVKPAAKPASAPVGGKMNVASSTDRQSFGKGSITVPVKKQTPMVLTEEMEESEDMALPEDAQASSGKRSRNKENEYQPVPYRGRFYGQGDLGFQLDPGLVARWDKKE